MRQADGADQEASAPASVALQERRLRSLRQFILGDAAACAVGAILCLLLYASTERAGFFLIQAVDLLICGAIIASAMRPALHGEEERAVTLLCAINWYLATVGALLTPHIGPVMSLAAVIPVVFAIRYVSWSRLRVLLGGTMVSLIAIGVLSRVQDVTRIDTHIPAAIEDTAVIGCVAMIASLILLVVWQGYQELVETNRTLYELTMDLTAKAEELAQSRARLVAATDDARRRIERDLHDGAQQKLTALAVRVQLAGTTLASHPQAGPVIAQLSADLRSAIRDIRDLAHGIYPPLLASAGLKAALPEAAARAGLGCSVDMGDIPRYPTEVEVAVYFCCLEALGNAAKHAGAGAQARLLATSTPERLTVTICDDGTGFDTRGPELGQGFGNMIDRLAVVGGTLDVRPAHPRGTVVRIEVARAPLT